MKPRKITSALFVALVGLVALPALVLQSCGGGGIGKVIPDEARLNAKTWRILPRYDYKGSSFDKGRVTASHRSLVESIRTQLKSDVTMYYNETPTADITVTVAERQENMGYGQIGGLSKRQTVYYIEFFDRDGERLGGYYDRNQQYIRTNNDPALVRQLAETILTALNGE
jgi:hypothetical protein